MLLRALKVSLLTIPAMLVWAGDVPPEVQKVIPIVKAWGEDPALVAAVRERNAQSTSLTDVQAKDREWQAATGVTPFMESLIKNAAGTRLVELETSSPWYFEVFLMDQLGANVAMTNKTSDYWQGDEAKFTESFKNGVGAVHVSEAKFDESAQAYLIQVSVPVMDEGKAIGALTVGVNLDELAE